MTLSEKMKKIVKDLNITQDILIKEIQKQNRELGSSASESSLKKIFSGQYDDYNKPKLSTIAKIINYLKSLDNTKYQNISYDYLLNDNNINISNENIKINELTGLKDETINNIQEITKENNNSLNNFINNIDIDFWEALSILNVLNSVETTLKMIKDKYDEHMSNTLKTSRQLLEPSYTKEISLQQIDEIEMFNRYDYILKNSKIIKILQKDYNIKDYPDFIYIYEELFHTDFMENVLFIRNKRFRYLWHYTREVLGNIQLFIKNNIAPPLELYKNLFNILPNLQFERNTIKYEINEYLTLYLNK